MPLTYIPRVQRPLAALVVMVLAPILVCTVVLGLPAAFFYFMGGDLPPTPPPRPPATQAK